MTESPLNVLAPVRGRLWIAGSIASVGALSGVIPMIAVAELARRILAEDMPLTTNVLWTLSLILGASMAIRIAAVVVANGVTHTADLDLQLYIRRRIARHLTLVSLGWFTQQSSGRLKMALQDDLTTLHHLVGHAIPNTVLALVPLPIALAYMAWIDPLLTIVALLPVCGGIALYASNFRNFDNHMADYTDALEQVSTASTELIEGIVVFKTSCQSTQALHRFRTCVDHFLKTFWDWMQNLLQRAVVSEALLSPTFTLTFFLSSGMLLLAIGSANAEDVIAISIFAPTLSAPVFALSAAQTDLVKSRDAASRILALLKVKPLKRGSGARPKGTDIKFENVWFGYDPTQPVLRNISLTLKAGSFTAVVGRSGSGKSTLAHMLPRFFDPDQGCITLGDINISSLTPEELYKKVGCIFQDACLLRASVEDNIALGRPDAQRNEVIAAAKAANIHDRIRALPEGYDTVVGDDLHLSGGERQRITIARALLADPLILVLDEATSFADVEAEARIQDALAQLLTGRTLLVVAHRLSSIILADQIVVMDNGKVVDCGTHRELLGRCHMYSDLWAAGSQTKDAA